MAKFRLRYSPLFYEDLNEITDYFLKELKNEPAAKDLVNKVEAAILKQLDAPISSAIYHSIGDRQHPYRRIRVGNFLIFYVVIKNTMIVRRLLYGRRDLDKIL